MTDQPLQTTDQITQRSIEPDELASYRRKDKSRAATFHDNHGQPLRTELSVQYPNMPRRERRRLARMLVKATENN